MIRMETVLTKLPKVNPLISKTLSLSTNLLLKMNRPMKKHKMKNLPQTRLSRKMSLLMNLKRKLNQTLMSLKLTKSQMKMNRI